MEIKNTNLLYKRVLLKSEKTAIWITDKVGTMGFFFLIFIWTSSWLSWNILAPKSLRFDPYPAFVMWLFISNMIQIFLMPLIMIGQNLQAKRAEIRAENDYVIDTKAEKEIAEIKKELTEIKTILQQISNK